MFLRSLTSERFGLFRKIVGLWLTLFLGLGPSSAFAATYFVNASTGDDTRTEAQAQSAATPWKTIEHAIEDPAVDSGDTVNVAAGTYDSASGEEFPLFLKDGVAIIGAGRDVTTISSLDGIPVFENFDTPLSNLTRLSGFTLKSETFSDVPRMAFFIGSVSMVPRIDANRFTGITTFPPANNKAGDNRNENGFFLNFGIFIGGTLDGGSFTGLIEGNEFEHFTGSVPVGLEDPFDFFAAGIGMFDPFFLFNPNDNKMKNRVDIIVASDNLSPTIRNNSFTENSNGIEVVSVPYVTKGISADDFADMTIAPLIEGNTFGTDEDDANYIDMIFANEAVANFSPTIRNNTSGFSFAHFFQVPYFYIYYGGGSLLDKGAPKAASGLLSKIRKSNEKNRFQVGSAIRPTLGLPKGLLQQKTGKGAAPVRPTALSATYAPTIEDNNVSNAYLGGYVFLNLFPTAQSLTLDVLIEDNDVIDSGSGILFLAEFGGESAEVADSILIQGNTITGSPDEGYEDSGITLNLAETTKVPAKNATRINAIDNDVQIVGNEITDLAGPGLELGSDNYSTQPILVSCNTITNNEGDGVIVLGSSDPNPDFGGGDRSSPGNNNIFGNGSPSGTFDFSNLDPDPIKAENNYWGTTDVPTIDSHIKDDNESTDGAVDFEPFLTSQAECAIIAAVDLSLTKSDAADPVIPGDAITYTLTATNIGSTPASSVVITDTLPPGTSFLSAGPGCTNGSGTVTCNIGALGVGETAIRQIQVVAPSSTGTITNSATVSSLETDTNTANNTDTEDTTVSTPPPTSADVSISKAANPSTVEVGGEINYILTISNAGPAAATGVVVTDAIPAGTSFISASAGCTFASGTVTCNVGTLANGASTTRTIVLRAPLTPGNIENTAVVDAAESDSSSGNNLDTGGAVVLAATADIPTVGEWGLIILTMLLALSAMWLMRRRELEL